MAIMHFGSVPWFQIYISQPIVKLMWK